LYAASLFLLRDKSRGFSAGFTHPHIAGAVLRDRELSHWIEQIFKTAVENHFHNFLGWQCKIAFGISEISIPKRLILSE
jgi:hypothetical protein